MRKPERLREIAKVKQVLAFLNEKFPSLPNYCVPNFVAYCPDTGEDFDAWHLCCRDIWLIRDNKKFNGYRLYMEKKHKVRFVVCYLHEVTISIMIDKKQKLILK